MPQDEPIPILLWCPECGSRHIDEGAFATKVHTTHACQNCGHCWRPAIVATTGVRFLPGFKTADATEVHPDALKLSQLEEPVRRVSSYLDKVEAITEGQARREPPGTIPCPACGFGVVFGDARGGYECTACDVRFHIQRGQPQGYGGPSGPLTALEQVRAWVGLWLLPKEKGPRPSPLERPLGCPICKAGPDENCDAGLHS